MLGIQNRDPTTYNIKDKMTMKPTRDRLSDLIKLFEGGVILNFAISAANTALLVKTLKERNMYEIRGINGSSEDVNSTESTEHTDSSRSEENDS